VREHVAAGDTNKQTNKTMKDETERAARLGKARAALTAALTRLTSAENGFRAHHDATAID
jgi:hypothetical protein